MKNMFPGYYAPTEAELGELWADATFVFDSSVLLQFYRLPEQTRNQAFKILEDLKGRVWIPHHVALEYHRGRVRSIIEARDLVAKSVEPIRRAFDEVYRAVGAVKLEDRGLADAVQKMQQIHEAGDAVISAAEGALAGHIDPNGRDPVGERISELFDGAIGPAPDQEQIKQLEAEAAARYAVKMGPGFKDDGKDSFRFGSLTYNRKYSDYLVWAQTSQFALQKGLKRLVIVTNDAKEDWWLKHNGVVWGPLQEMYAEMLSVAKLDRFWMYSFEQFLASAGDRLKVDVSQTTLSDVASSAQGKLGSISEMVSKAALHRSGFYDLWTTIETSPSERPRPLESILTVRGYHAVEPTKHGVIGFREGDGQRLVGGIALGTLEFIVLGGKAVEHLAAALVRVASAKNVEIFVHSEGHLGDANIEFIEPMVAAALDAADVNFRSVVLYLGSDSGRGWTLSKIR